MCTAAKKNDIPILKLLLEYEGQVSECALNKAIDNNHTEMVELLLEKGAKIGITSIKNAIGLQNPQMLQLLVNKNKAAAACLLHEGNEQQKNTLLNINFKYNAEDFDDNARMKCALSLRKSQQVQDLFQQGVAIPGTLVGITHILGEWSSNILQAALHIASLNDEMYVLPISNEQRSDINFLQRFDGLINPGAGDSFPRDIEFGIEQFSMNDTEKMYQTALEVSNKTGAPYLGICSGSQHLILNKGGKLKEVQGYKGGNHKATFIEGTFSHFSALSQIEQENTLKNCEFAKISLKIDTAHRYAGVKDQLAGVKLGAVSEEGVVQSTASVTGQLGIQFHPENFYNDNYRSTLLINNFFERINEYAKLMSYAQKHGLPVEKAQVNFQQAYQMLNHKLEECVSHPQSQADFYPEFNNTPAVHFLDEFYKIMFNFEG